MIVSLTAVLVICFSDEVAVIDEIQMMRDSQRGWAWTRALLGIVVGCTHCIYLDVCTAAYFHYFLGRLFYRVDLIDSSTESS